MFGNPRQSARTEVQIVFFFTDSGSKLFAGPFPPVLEQRTFGPFAAVHHLSRITPLPCIRILDSQRGNEGELLVSRSPGFCLKTKGGVLSLRFTMILRNSSSG